MPCNGMSAWCATAPFFRYSAPGASADGKMVSLTFASWNQLDGWLRFSRRNAT